MKIKEYWRERKEIKMSKCGGSGIKNFSRKFLGDEIYNDLAKKHKKIEREMIKALSEEKENYGRYGYVSRFNVFYELFSQNFELISHEDWDDKQDCSYGEKWAYRINHELIAELEAWNSSGESGYAVTFYKNFGQ